jgi:hypothetical protein
MDNEDGASPASLKTRSRAEGGSGDRQEGREGVEQEEVATLSFPPPSPSPASGEGSAIDWGEVRRAYEACLEPVSAIRERFGLNFAQLRKRREKEDWVPRPSVAIPGRLKGQALRAAHPLTLRLMRIVANETTGIEERQKGGAPLSEHDLRRATYLAHIVEHIVKASRKPIPPQKKASGETREKKNKNDTRTDDLAWLRAELKRRLDALSEETQGGAGQVRRKGIAGLPDRSP